MKDHVTLKTDYWYLKCSYAITGINYILKYVKIENCKNSHHDILRRWIVTTLIPDFNFFFWIKWTLKDFQITRVNILFTIEHREHNKCLNWEILHFYPLNELISNLCLLQVKGEGRRPLLDARGLRALRRHCITHRHDSVIDITKWAQEYFQKPLLVNTICRAICRCQL